MLRRLCVAVCLLVGVGAANAATLNVGPSGSGAAYTTIQSAITAAHNGDTVLVAPGTYYETIDFVGRAITVTSSGGAASTIIDGGAIVGKATVIFQSGESTGSVLSAFTIRNGGHAPLGNGPTGGVYISNGSPSILNNVFSANSCASISIYGGSALIQGNEITGTLAGSNIGCTGDGSPIFISGGTPTIADNTIENNLQGGYAGAIFSSAGAPIIQGNTIRNNIGGNAGAIQVFNTDAITIVQNLIYKNSASSTGYNISGGITILAPYTNVGPFTGIIAGNTIADNSLTGSYYTPGTSATDLNFDGNLTQFALVNNVISNASTVASTVTCETIYSYLDITPLAFDHNDIYNASGPAYSGSCVFVPGQYGNISAAPLYVDATNGNYAPRTSPLPVSPLIDAGNNSAPLQQQLDLTGSARVVDATGVGYPIVDMGAFEATGLQDLVVSHLTLTPSEYFASATPSPAPPPLTFTVSLASLSGVPTGPVTIYEDGTSLSTVQVGSSGTATFSGANVTSGLHAFTATFPGVKNGAGDLLYSPAVSVKFFLLVPGSLTSLSLSSTPNPSTVGSMVTFTVNASGANGTVPSPIKLTDTTTGTVLANALMPDGTGKVSYPTSSLALGNHVIVASFAGSASQGASSASLTQQVTGIAVTGISPTSGPAAGGTMVTITGTGFTGTTAVSFGGVAATSFTANSDTSITAVSPAGTGTVDVIVTAAGSSSAASSADKFTYIGPQTITFPQPSAAYVATSVLLNATASSGLPVMYKVVSGPGNVSGAVLTYTGVGSVVVEADQAGDGTNPAAPAVQKTVSATLLTEPVGTSSNTVSTVVVFSDAGRLSSVSALMQGATGLDFAQVVGGSCAVGTTYAAGQNCTVEFTFKPTRPGQRYGGIVLKDASENTLANSYVYGVGVGPQVAWLPDTQTHMGTNLNEPCGVAIDGNGNLFVSQYGGGLTEILANGTERVIGLFGLTSDVAVDGSGNVIVASQTTAYEVLAVNGVIPVNPTIITLATGFSSINGVAVDATGNVFLGNGNGAGADGAVYELVAVNGSVPASSTPKTVGNGLKYVTGVKVDANGNVYASDDSLRGVYEIHAVNGVVDATSVTSALGGTFTAPSNVGLDAANDVYVTDADTGIISELVAVNGVVPANPTIRTIGKGIVEPQGMVVAGNGNVYIADMGISQIVELDYADPPTLTFATTNVGSVSSDSPQTVTIANDGNAPFVFTVPATGTNASITAGFTIGGGSTCPQLTSATTSAPQLAEGASCTEQVSFQPVVGGPVTGAMTIADNAVGLTQTVVLNGTGVAATTTVVQSSLNPAPVGVPVTFTATVSSNSGTPTGSVTFTFTTAQGLYLTTAPQTLSGGVATYTTSTLPRNVYTVTATYAATTAYQASSASLTQTIGSQSVTTTSVMPQPSTYGQPVTFSVHVQGAPGTTGQPSGTVNFVYCHGAQASVTLDASGNGSYVEPVAGAISEPVGSCPYTAEYLGDMYFFPSNSALTPWDVTPATSKITMTSATPNPGYVNQPVTLVATVVGTPSPTSGPGGVILQPGATVATGSVQFYDGGAAINGAVTLTAAQTATLSTTFFSLGSHTITAKYSGDANLQASTTTTGLIEVIQQVPTSAVLLVAPNPGFENQPVTIGVTVASLAGVDAPYGSVVISDGTTVLTSLQLAQGAGLSSSVSFTTSTLAAGTHPLQATFVPAPSVCPGVVCPQEFLPSRTAVVNEVIQPQDFSVGANPPSITIQTKHHASMTLTVTPVGQFVGPVTLACVDSEPYWASCAFSPVTIRLNGTAAVSTVLTIDTDEIKGYASNDRGSRNGAPWLALVVPFALLGLRKKRRGVMLALALAGSMAVLSMSACSGRQPDSVTPGTYTLTVQGTGTAQGAIVGKTHTLAITLKVTP